MKANIPFFLRPNGFRGLPFVILLGGLGCLLATTGDLCSGTFRALSWTNPIDEVFYSPTGDEKDLKKFSAFTHARSAPYTYQDGVAAIRFFRMEPGPEGQMVPVEIGRAPLANGGSSPLILLFDNPKKAGTYLTQVMEDSPASFGAGGFRFVNFTTTPIAVNLGEEKFRLEPNASKTVAGKPRTIGKVPNVLDVGVYAFFEKNPVQVFGNIWSCNPALRNLIFIVQVPNLPRAVEVKRITDDPKFQLPSADEPSKT